MKRWISGLILAGLLFAAVPAMARGPVASTATAENGAVTITVNSADGSNIRLAGYTLENGKLLRLTYENGAGTSSRIVLTLPAGTCLPPVRVNLQPMGAEGYRAFSDVPDTLPQKEHIQNLYDQGAVSGYPDGHFGPYDSVTRAEFAVMAVKLGHLPDTEAPDVFSDLKGHWGRRMMLRARAAGLLNGYSDGTVRPDSEVTFAEAAVMVSKLYTFRGKARVIVPKLDTSAWYADYLQTLFDAGVVQFDDTLAKNFDPNRQLSRADCALLLSRASSTW